MKNKYNYVGFSLIELSIVIIIMGLLIVGVIAGAGLVSAARVRSLVSEIRNYQTAVHVFYTNKGRFPGDKSGKGRVDNNGISYNSDSFPGPYNVAPNIPKPEGGLFVDLFLEKLIDFEPVKTGNGVVGEALPPSKPYKEWYYRSGYISGYSYGFNSYSHSSNNAKDAGNSLMFSTIDSPTTNSLAKMELFQQIDVKIDDGRSNGGDIRAVCWGNMATYGGGVTYDDAEKSARNNPSSTLYGCSILYIRVGTRGTF
ncbi:MAG: hypothetical protein LBG48_04940 [Rickettsiales bacterium]|nr:hypothetical protein [Rickettsiales bacterium]